MAGTANRPAGPTSDRVKEIKAWQQEQSSGLTLKRVSDSSPRTMEARTCLLTTQRLRRAVTARWRRTRRSSSTSRRGLRVRRRRISSPPRFTTLDSPQETGPA
ncbi:putative cold shock protein [Paenarthrobacter aurescens TC1]|uniref:Cold shock protein n=1 Tax=Paenarthrobacter aurescens (strain TC1) TaxID=290340 RepID=A1R688_PAEAT|nr:putative cold shock protein [Paenarthrobacter aurescens TC1]